MHNPAKTVKVTLVIFFAVALILYALYETHDLIQGPTIVVTEPQDGATVMQEFINVRGTAKNISHLYFDGRQIFTNKTGTFEEQLLVPVGYTILELKADDRFNRETVRRIRIIRQDPQS